VVTEKNGAIARWLVQLLLPAFVAAFASYVAVTSRITAVEVKIDERTAALREGMQERTKALADSVAATRVQHDKDVLMLQREIERKR
jgi:hypothetical protein